MAEWEAYDQLDPIGEYRADTRFAMVCSVITNLARSIWGKKGSKMSTPSDFTLEWDSKKPKTKRKQSMDEMKNILAMSIPNYKAKK